MKIQTYPEIVDELLENFKTPDQALRVLSYAIRKMQQVKTLVEACPQLTEMNYAFIELKSRNYGIVPLQ